jgi:hypothetical protein
VADIEDGYTVVKSANSPAYRTVQADRGHERGRNRHGSAGHDQVAPQQWVKRIIVGVIACGVESYRVGTVVGYGSRVEGLEGRTVGRAYVR